MWISLTPEADLKHVKERLQDLGLWARPCSGSTGEVTGLLIKKDSRAVPREVILDIPGVADLAQASPKHPKLDAQAHKPVLVGHIEVGNGAPVLMAGPCSVESEAQIHEAAEMAASAGATVLRGGVFKPRTSPYAFTGVGRKGLPWMRAAADKHKMAVVTEVMSEGDVDAVAEYADLFQVGSRNMQNYALLKAIGRAGKPVLLKRSMSAFFEDWLLAGEHLLHAGASGVIFCERGVRGFDPNTRNLLDLAAVALLKSVYGQPVVVDPSHSVGRRDLVHPMSRAALAAGADGLMVEAHPNPSVALSDGPQSLHPKELVAIGQEMTRWHAPVV